MVSRLPLVQATVGETTRTTRCPQSGPLEKSMRILWANARYLQWNLRISVGRGMQIQRVP
jgi:hypothetical protein